MFMAHNEMAQLNCKQMEFPQLDLAMEKDVKIFEENVSLRKAHEWNQSQHFADLYWSENQIQVPLTHFPFY